jgi:hypothetical protein
LKKSNLTQYPRREREMKWQGLPIDPHSNQVETLSNFLLSTRTRKILQATDRVTSYSKKEEADREAKMKSRTVIVML